MYGKDRSRRCCGARYPWRGTGVESTDRAIDALVYELSPMGMIYGLTEAEIKIVEGS
jgi:hypothetical protein